VARDSTRDIQGSLLREAARVSSIGVSDGGIHNPFPGWRHWGIDIRSTWRSISPQKLRRSLWCCSLNCYRELFIAFFKQGAGYVALEGRSMIFGAVALAFYNGITCQLMKRFQLSALTSTALAGVGWLGLAFGLYWLFLRGSS
jgi:hypothetical protein